MEKSKKWFIVLVMISPVVILPIILIISGIKIKEIPWIVLIGVPVVILASPFAFFFAQRKAQRRPPNASLRKRRKELFITLGVIIVIYLIGAVICHIAKISFWQVLLNTIGMFLIVIAISLYIFFKDKEQKPTEEIETKRNTESDNQNDSRI